MNITPSFRFFGWLAANFVASVCLSASAVPLPAPVSVPRFTHPGAGQTFYFVLTDRFTNGNPANDTGGIAGGAEQHGFDPTRIGYFHGGDLAGLTARLDYLKRLGATAIWITPPLTNNPVQLGSAGYHGYWITDFLRVDAHLGTNDEYREFIRQAHARGLRVYMDIVINHSADIIQYADGDTRYRDKVASPYRDDHGRPFDDRAVAYNGLNDPTVFPSLSAETSFPRRPVVGRAAATVKNPAWLNDVTLYHNRGNSTFAGESALNGDFVGLDDLFTEHPRVVRGFIEVFSQWLDYGIDGYRIDTVRHVNAEFWQAFGPAIRTRARALGRPDFLQFGEAANGAGDPVFLSEFSTSTIPLDATIDFGFFVAARKFVSQAGTAAALADFFAQDDHYTDHDSNVHSTTTFLGNHDAGRFGYFLQQDNPGASAAQLADLVRLGHGLLLLSRGQPVLYYGDEQGMIGQGGDDMKAREDMFASQSPEFRNASLLATTKTGADDKFDETHPFYRFIARLNSLRAAHRALRTGAMIPRAASAPEIFSFSRLDRSERVEYVVALNNSRTTTVTASIPTSQPPGGILAPLFDSRRPESDGGDPLTAGAGGAVQVTLPPLQFAVWRATASLPSPAPLQIALVNPSAGASLTINATEVDGLTFPTRQEIRAEVSGGDGVAEVTFALARSSRPGQLDLLGTDDAPPYRVFWSPPADLAPGEEIAFLAAANDLRGHLVTTQSGAIKLAPTKVAFGIKDSKTPHLTKVAPTQVSVEAGATITLSVEAEGSGALEFQWLHDGEQIVGATSKSFSAAHAGATDAGEYRVLVHNLAGTCIGPVTSVTVSGARQIERHAAFPSQFVASRPIEV